MQVPRTGRGHVPVCFRKILTKMYSIPKSLGRGIDSCLLCSCNAYMHEIWGCCMLWLTCEGEGGAAKQGRQRRMRLGRVLRPGIGSAQPFPHGRL